MDPIIIASVPRNRSNKSLTSLPPTSWMSTDIQDNSLLLRKFARVFNNRYGCPFFELSSSHPSYPTGFRVSSQSTPEPSSDNLGSISHTAHDAISGGHGTKTALSARAPVGGLSNILRNWTARIRCNQHELGDNFSVLLFLVQVPEDPTEWLTSPNFVGSFNTHVDNAYGNQRSQSDGVEGFVHLNNAIMGFSDQNSLEPAVVVPFLTNNLHWRVLKMDGTAAELLSLEVVVIMTPLTLPPGSKFPVAGEPQCYYGITYGRPGGSRHA